MTNISTQAKNDNIQARLNIKFQQAMERDDFDKMETCFAGKCTLTKEQYMEGMKSTLDKRDEDHW